MPAINTNQSDLRQPWTWILPGENTFNPPKYLTVAITVNGVTSTAINWVSQVSPAVAFMYIPLIALAIYLAIKKKGSDLSLMVLVWSLVAFLPWLWLGLFVQRMTFNYYFIYTIPALCLGIPLFWDSLKIRKRYKYVALTTQLMIVFGTFLIYFPVVLFR